MTMRKHHKRRKRRRAKMLAKHGPGSVRPHKRKTGRTGNIRSKQTPPSRPRPRVSPEGAPEMPTPTDAPVRNHFVIKIMQSTARGMYFADGGRAGSDCPMRVVPTADLEEALLFESEAEAHEFVTYGEGGAWLGRDGLTAGKLKLVPVEERRTVHLRKP